jgi:hypothetical protein
MFNPNPFIDKQDYEERVRWLQSLYDRETNEPGRVSRWVNRLLYILGSSFVALGERMQSRDTSPTLRDKRA